VGVREWWVRHGRPIVWAGMVELNASGQLKRSTMRTISEGMLMPHSSINHEPDNTGYDKLEP
jgi:hypothetical protein